MVEERELFFANAFFGAPRDHPFMARLVDRVGASIEARPQANPQVVSGPVFFTDQLIEWRAEMGEAWSEIDRDLVFPYSFDKLDQGSGPWAPDVIAVHAWDGARKGRSLVDPHNVAMRDQLRRSLRLRIRSALRRLRVKLNAVRRVARRVGDESLHRFLSKTLSGSDVYVDVGANIGQLADTAARSLSSYGRVFVYEPNPQIADTLSLNVEIWSTSGVRAEVIQRRFAVSDSTLPVTLRVPSLPTGGGSTVSTSVSDVDGSERDRYEVSCVILDDELGHLSRIRLIKIDVEAHEAEVLTGTTALIESGRVDFVVLVDIKSVRAHNDSNIIRLGAILDRWQDLGATFADIGSRGGLIPIQQRGSRIVTSRDRSDLIIDARPIRAALQRS